MIEYDNDLLPEKTPANGQEIGKMEGRKELGQNDIDHIKVMGETDVQTQINALQGIRL